MNENVVTQKLRDFTVQIRPANSENIVGTGVVVSTDGKVVTCAHVVKAAGVEPHTLNEKELVVYFPQAQGGEKKDRRAKVIACFPDFDDDVVLLQLMDGNVPLGPEKMPVLGTAENSQGNGFRSYGYRRLEDYIAGWAHGTIHGYVEAPPKRNVQAEPVQLESNQINRGMSGSAVLDIERNLVIGIISETWFPDKSGKDSDTGWAVDSYVLNLAPLGLPVQDAPLPYKPAPKPKTDEETKQQVVRAAQVTVAERGVRENFSWNNAPLTIPEWTGREHLLLRLTEDWNDPKKRVTGLIGFGGEGKSSLARKWVETFITSNVQRSSFDGLFWWSFYENRSVDDFFESALKYFGVDSRRYQSSIQRAQIVGVLLNTGRYLFVLDGFEVMQHQDGDQYGLLQSNDLRDLLTFFAQPDNQSFCLITSRAPLLDLMEYTSYTHRDVERLSEEDGRTLLRRLGVQGSDTELNQVVSDWDGHALTLSILAAYLVDRYDGDIKHRADIPVPTADEPRYERVRRVLRRYDENLSTFERDFLIIFSAFRTPVPESALVKVFKPLLHLDIENINFLVHRLTDYRLLRYNKLLKTYSSHVLIRGYYSILSQNAPSQTYDIHKSISNFYWSLVEIPNSPSIDDLQPLIEVIHHTCRAGDYDEAMRFTWDERLNKLLLSQLGAYETFLLLLLDFFQGGDFSRNILVSNEKTKTTIYYYVGLCLMNLGRLGEASIVYKKVLSDEVETESWANAYTTAREYSKLSVYLGNIQEGQDLMSRSLMYSRRTGNLFSESYSLAALAWIAHLKGDVKTAHMAFKEAQSLLRMYDPETRYLYHEPGNWYAQYLIHIKEYERARHVIEKNLEACDSERWVVESYFCRLLLGDIEVSAGNLEVAQWYYDQAEKFAYLISHYPLFINTMLRRGRFYAQKKFDPTIAKSNLEVCLDYSIRYGYRIYEADVRIALAWTYLANNEKEKAKQSAERALQMSNEIGYYWGKVDAEEVLERLKAEG
jgi:tetratricopeptide (TPR) repeat protein